MKIGIDVMPLQNELTGVGNYLLRLLEELIPLRPHDTFYLYRTHTNPLLQRLAQSPRVFLRTNSLFGFSEALWSQTTLAWMCYKDQIDLFWGATQSLPLLTAKRQKHLLTIYDFAYLLYPETVSSMRGRYLRIFSKFFYKKADIRTAISRGTADRLQQLFSLETQKIIPPPPPHFLQKDNVQNPASLKKLLNSYGLEEKKYFLMIGTLEPRKNICMTLQAYMRLARQKKINPLVLVGKLGWKDKAIQKEIDQLAYEIPNQVKVLGYIEETCLYDLLRGAQAYLMPSFYEGYGMPIAEARSLKTPVICSNIPEMIEAAEGDAFFLDLHNFEANLHEALTSPLPAPKKCTYPTSLALATLLSQQIDILSRDL